MVRVATFAIPLLASVAAGVGAARVLPEPSGALQTLLWWLAIITVSSLVMTGVDRYTKRLLPLAALLKLSMLFPDQAPSRYKFARRISGSKALERELASMRAGQAWSDRQQAAETILALVGALGDYDGRTRGHSERTQLFVTLLADELKLKEGDRDRLVWGALVHDIGKLRVPAAVLNKPGKPTDEEWAILKSHPSEGAAICEPLQEWLGEWYAAIEQHHERWDGAGYPLGLAGTDIGLAGRIVAVADSYEVMTAARPYKKPMSAADARQELTRCAGSQFDPEIVRAFLNISLGRLRWVAGPLSWVAQMPFLRPIPNLGQVAGAVSGGVGAVAGVVALGLAPLLGGHSTIPSAEAGAREQPKATAAVSTPSASPSKPADKRGPPRRGPPAVPSAAPSETPTPAPQVPLNGVPAATDDEAWVKEDGWSDIAVMANDSDPDGDELSVALGAKPRHGSVEAVEDGAFRYRPDRDFAGTDSFRYDLADTRGATASATVTVHVAPANDAPLARADSAVTAEDTTTQLDVLANDTDVDGDRLVAAVEDAPRHGSVVMEPDGATTYVPAAHFHGVDTVTYRVTDVHGASDTAAVSIKVTPVNDAPVAGDESVTLAEDSNVVVDVLANDSDVDSDPLSVTVVSGPSSGWVSVAPTGKITYTPDPNFNGDDSLTYEVSDGNGGTDRATVSFTVTALNDAPVAGDDVVTVAEDSSVSVAVLANDSDVDGDTMTPSIDTMPADGDATVEADGTVTYVPHGDFSGTDTFTYTVGDGNGGADTATVTVTVTPVADPPVARPDAFTVQETQPLVGSLLANDSDEDGDSLEVQGTDPLPAWVTVAADGTITMTPPVGSAASSPYTFDYTVTDLMGGVDTATVTVTVTTLPVTATAAFLNPPADTVQVGVMTLTDPSTPFVGDWDSDGIPGLTVRSGGTSETESDPEKFQMWDLTVPSGGLGLNGPVSLELWTSLEGEAFKNLDYSAWLYECSPGCTPLTATEDLHVDDWSTTTTWERRTVSVGSVTRNIAAGSTLRLRLGFGHKDVWMPLADGYESKLIFTTGG